MGRKIGAGYFLGVDFFFGIPMIEATNGLDDGANGTIVLDRNVAGELLLGENTNMYLLFDVLAFSHPRWFGNWQRKSYKPSCKIAA